jgi:hypothetical protein
MKGGCKPRLPSRGIIRRMINKHSWPWQRLCGVLCDVALHVLQRRDVSQTKTL